MLPIQFDSLDIKAVSWDGNTLDWIWYSPDSQSLYILDQDKWKFSYGKKNLTNIDLCNVSKVIGDYWVQLIAYDLWSNRISSNKFKVTINPSFPPLILNRFGPIMVYPNYYTEVDIPNDLFNNFVNQKHIYRLANWIEKSKNVATKFLTKVNKNFSLLVEVFGNRGCTLFFLILMIFDKHPNFNLMLPY